MTVVEDYEVRPFSEELRGYLAALARWLWLLAAGPALAAGMACLVSLSLPPVYQASTLVLVEAPLSGPIDYTSVLAGERLAVTYAERLATRPVLEAVIARLELDVSPAGLQGAVQVRALRDTPLIEVVVESTDPQQAAGIANALVAEFSRKNLAQQASRLDAPLQDLESRLAQLDGQLQAAAAALDHLDPGDRAGRDRLEADLAEGRQAYELLLQSSQQVRLAEAQFPSLVVQEEPAVPPLEPVRPRVVFNTLLGGVFGFLLALGGVIVAEALDDTLHSPDELSRQLGLPVLGILPHWSGGADGLPAAVAPRSPFAEALRSLRTSLDLAGTAGPLRTLLLAGPSPGEGKSTIAANLAVVLAQGERRVVLVDADLRRPRLHLQLGLSDRPGLGDLLLSSSGSQAALPALDPYLQATSVPGLNALAAGNLPPDPATLLAGDRLPALLDRLLEIAAVVVVDSPPALAVTDALLLAIRVDAVLLVVRPGVTRLAACRGCIEQLQQAGAKLVGVVVNDVPGRRPPYSSAPPPRRA